MTLKDYLFPKHQIDNPAQNRKRRILPQNPLVSGMKDILEVPSHQVQQQFKKRLLTPKLEELSDLALRKKQKKPLVHVIRQRKVLAPSLTESDWENLILGCLSGTKRTWGCLHKNGELFMMKTMRKVKPPWKIITSLLVRNLIYLGGDFYRYQHKSFTKRTLK